MSKENVLEILRLSRAFCASKLPWFAPALYRCNIVLTDKISVAAIDNHYNIYFNPDAIEKIIEESPNKETHVSELGFLWVHEISHVLRDHAERNSDISAEKFLWNIAADLEINDNNWLGMEMPKAFIGVLPKDFNYSNGELAEHYYFKLIEEKERIKSILSAKNLIGYNEGSGIHNEAELWEIGNNQQKIHPLDLKIIRQSVANEMKNHPGLIGNMPGNWNLWIENVLQSKTDWKKVLKHRLSMALNTGMGLKVDYSFARPSRRQSIYSPIITPSFTGSKGGRIAIVVDTSGSMNGSLLEQAVGEVFKILEEFKLPVTVIPCDTKAYEPIVLKKPSDRFKVQNLTGGGGTDMVAGIQAALDMKPQPDTVLVLTDGYTPYPESTFRTPVVFGIIYYQNNQETHFPSPPMPPWNESSVVKIGIKQEQYRRR